MKRSVLLVLMLLLVGCNVPIREEISSSVERQRTVEPIEVPEPEEVCLKPEDSSGIVIDFGNQPGHGTGRVKPGWGVALQARPMRVALEFPKPVNRSLIKVTVEPSSWQVTESELEQVSDTSYRFNLVPSGEVERDLGWVTLRVEGTGAVDGDGLDGLPFSVRFFAYNQELKESHPHLGECQGSLVIHVER